MIHASCPRIARGSTCATCAIATPPGGLRAPPVEDSKRPGLHWGPRTEQYQTVVGEQAWIREEMRQGGGRAEAVETPASGGPLSRPARAIFAPQLPSYGAGTAVRFPGTIWG